ncbi:hypothetical protein MD484_g8436, partial [Candolleomyces efflorescens]
MEFVIWHKDMLSKEPYAWDDPNNKPFSLHLLSSKSNTIATGSIQLKLGFALPPNTESLMEWEAVYRELVKRSRPSIVSAPATEGVGTVRSNGGLDFADDGGLSSSDSEDDEDEDEDETFVDALDSTEPITLSSSPRPEDGFKSPDTPTPANTAPTPTAASTPQLAAPTPKLSTGFIPKMKFPRKLSSRSSSTPTSTTSTSSSTVGTPGPSPLPTPILEAAPTDAGEKKARKASGVKKSKSKAEYQFEGGKDIVGIVMLEIQSAEDLPWLRNTLGLRIPTFGCFFGLRARFQREMGLLYNYIQRCLVRLDILTTPDSFDSC